MMHMLLSGFSLMLYFPNQLFAENVPPPNTLTDCWIIHSGICIEEHDPCPFTEASEVKDNANNQSALLCDFQGLRCCIPPSPESVHSYNDYKCGIPSVVRDFRIFYGIAAVPGEFPWQAKIHLKGEHICGGALIHPKWVLTAAHCTITSSRNTTLYEVWLGYTSTEQNSKLIQKAAVANIYENPDFLEWDYGDITLLELTQPVRLNKFVRTVCLPNPNESFENMICTVTGFGMTENGTLSEDKLIELAKPIVPNKQCESLLQVFDPMREITDGEICAGFLSGKRDSSQGDSGGPLVCRKQDLDNVKRWVLAGLTSSGMKCGQAKQPAIYTRVSQYLTWIQENTGLKFYR